MDVLHLGQGRHQTVRGDDSAWGSSRYATCSTPTLLEVLAAKPRLLAVAVEAREPGNVGTIIRCADAMGADAVVLLGDSVDPHNGKCVRSSAGSVFHLPIVRERSITDGLNRIRAAGITILVNCRRRRTVPR